QRSLKGHTNWISSVAFSPKGDLLASGGTDGTAILWDPASGKRLLTLDGKKGHVNGLAFSKDGKTLAAAADSGTTLWDVATGTEQLALVGPTRQYGAAFSADGKSLATASLDKVACVWDVPTGKPRLDLKEDTSTLSGIAFARDGKTVAVARHDDSGSTIYLWD